VPHIDPPVLSPAGLTHTNYQDSSAWFTAGTAVTGYLGPSVNNPSLPQQNLGVWFLMLAVIAILIVSLAKQLHHETGSCHRHWASYWDWHETGSLQSSVLGEVLVLYMWGQLACTLLWQVGVFSSLANWSGVDRLRY